MTPNWADPGDSIGWLRPWFAGLSELMILNCCYGFSLVGLYHYLLFLLIKYMFRRNPKKTIFAWMVNATTGDKGTRQRPFSPRQSVHTLFFGNTAKSLPSAKKHTTKNFSENLFLKIWNKKDLIWEGPHWPATRLLHETHKSRNFLCTMRPARFEPATSPSRVTSSTTTPLSHVILNRVKFAYLRS